MLMQFSQSGKERLVWHPEQKRVIAEFHQGRFKTEDAVVQEHLLKLGYQELTAAQQAEADAQQSEFVAQPGAFAASGPVRPRNIQGPAMAAPAVESPKPAPAPAPAARKAKRRVA